MLVLYIAKRSRFNRSLALQAGSASSCSRYRPHIDVHHIIIDIHAICACEWARMCTHGNYLKITNHPCMHAVLYYILLFIIGRREILSLSVKCGNERRNCTWTGTVDKLSEHMALCEFSLIPCPEKCKDLNEIVLVMKKDMDEHLRTECPNRDYVCEFCAKRDTYTKIAREHYQVCKKKTISCSNDECGKKMERRNLKRQNVNTLHYLASTGSLDVMQK